MIFVSKMTGESNDVIGEHGTGSFLNQNQMYLHGASFGTSNKLTEISIVYHLVI